jgi:hypothetical protein
MGLSALYCAYRLDGLARAGLSYWELVPPLVLSAFGVAVQVAVLAAAGSYASADAFIAGVGPALAACAALALLGATAGTTLRARRPAAVVQVAVAQG